MLPLSRGPALRPRGAPTMSNGLLLSGRLSKTNYIQAVDNFCLLVVVGVRTPDLFWFYRGGHSQFPWASRCFWSCALCSNMGSGFIRPPTTTRQQKHRSSSILMPLTHSIERSKQQALPGPQERGPQRVIARGKDRIGFTLRLGHHLKY